MNAAWAEMLLRAGAAARERWEVGPGTRVVFVPPAQDWVVLPVPNFGPGDENDGKTVLDRYGEDAGGGLALHMGYDARADALLVMLPEGVAG